MQGESAGGVSAGPRALGRQCAALLWQVPALDWWEKTVSINQNMAVPSIRRVYLASQPPNRLAGNGVHAD